MPEINLSNSAKRDAVVGLESIAIPVRVRWIDGKGRSVKSVRLMKSTSEFQIDQLTESVGGIENVSQALIDGDPEVDMEMAGSFVSGTSRVYVDQEGQVAHRVEEIEVVRDPEGKEVERRPRRILLQNVCEDSPLVWSGKTIPKDEAIRKFVFAGKMQLSHINGLTYDFLFSMAKELHDKDALLLLGAGPKSNQPLVLRRGTTPYRGFLEGRIEGDKYCLLLHLSNLELKAPEDQSEDL